ncbi:hypothetical protein G6M26_23400 [Agrobacterium tumefaciens]|nr:hypothetical protein [Agrobacterium tumefaciens]NTE21490.1 hypothetical protein [Agrobacterium tumefaciens]
MKIIFDKEIEMPSAMLAKFESLISKNSSDYQKQFDEFILKTMYPHDTQFEIDERIETDDVIYRLKFEPLIDLSFIHVKVIDYKEFKKN